MENLAAAVPAGGKIAFYRTSAGAEIDLVVTWGKRERWAIEIKRGSAPQVSRGFHLGCEDVKATRRLVVYPGRESFSLGHGVEAMSLLQAVGEFRARK